jgi:hypothetical protein
MEQKAKSGTAFRRSAEFRRQDSEGSMRANEARRAGESWHKPEGLGSGLVSGATVYICDPCVADA